MTEIVELFPEASGALGPAALLARYAPADRSEPRLRVNFIQSVDGSATLEGRSGGLGGPADKAVFDILRGVSDVVLVGAGTARAEGYGALVVTDDLVEWRLGQGLPAHPAMALVSSSLDLDPASDLFAKAFSPPIVFTVPSAPADARARLAEVATVIDAGGAGPASGRVDPVLVRRELLDRGLSQVLCEGGPRLFGDLIAADLVDELCLTLSPVLEGGGGPRIALPARDGVVPRGLELVSLLRSGSMLLSRWART
ncbi:pyrimidine reductase family protein [Herbiconiux ginsengi]|uniref:Pyrimidine reductase, riboflavin biosynthesis n=1 Tax=Herbiconiux ginsengi TaxID=381665 RepID=A0A1H3QIR3_9MICO|nr:pyrimidine reductase family protein [Herbiconiux ginsengi]SDZ12938.1 Pyrimidine reductase, riboflavin biosynthesis [Herbiconiux ginsengi]